MYSQVAAFQPSIIYQQDGAPPHCSMDVRGSLKATFPNRWIGREERICWPPRSPDPTLFLWGYVKDRVFAIPVNDVGELLSRIRDVIGTIKLLVHRQIFIKFKTSQDFTRLFNTSQVFL